jgi:hypothetical protein
MSDVVGNDISTGRRSASGAIFLHGVVFGIGVILQAETTNRTNIEIRGISSLVPDPGGGAPTTDPGYSLAPGKSITLLIEDPSRLFLFAANPNDAVRYLVLRNVPTPG